MKKASRARAASGGLPGFDWNDLRYFLAVARFGGLSAAALELGGSPSTVSRHLLALEKHLGVRLFLRQQSGYLLTDEGSALFERVVEVERSTEAVARGTAGGPQADGASGLVRLASPEGVAIHLVAPHLHELRARHPHLQVELLVGQAQADLSRREADLALRLVDPDGQEWSRDHVALHVGRMCFGLYAARPTQRGSEPAWRDRPYINWDAAWAHLPTAAWLERLYSPRTAAFTSNSMETQIAAARGGLGVALIPLYIGDADPGLSRVPVNETLPHRDLWLVYHRDLKGSSRVQAMKSFLVQLLAARLPVNAAA